MLWYFSPTGTGRRAAKRLETAFPGLEAADLTLPAARAEPPEIRPGELFTLLFPVHGHRLPGPLRCWLEQLPTARVPVCLICTYGSVGTGNVLRRTARLLERKGMAVIAAAELPGPHSYGCAETGRDLSRAGETDLKGLCAFYRAVLEKAAGGNSTPTAMPGGFDPVGLLPEGFPLERLTAYYPAPDPARCTGCGRCSLSCPTGAAGGDRKACIRCAACVHACPAKARRLRFHSPFPARFLERQIQKRPPRFIL